MRLVLAALSRPITVVVALIAVALFAVLAVQRMPVDIFPQVGDPAIYVAQPYGGMDPAQMEGYITYYYEYHFLYITGIDRVESKSIQGAALMKLTFHQGTDMNQAISETIGYVNRARAFMPPGTVPPFVTRFDAGSVAVGLLVFDSSTHTQGELQDYALNRVRPLFATLPGVSAPPPFGGNQRTIVITLDPDKLHQYQISPDFAIAAISKSSLVMPSGNTWTGKINRIARTNAALGADLSQLLSTPIRPVSGATVYLRDIGTIENGTDLVTAYAHVNGKRTVYIPVTKRADSSTLAVINEVKAAIPSFKKVVPDDVDVRLEFDQSTYVAASVRSLVSEGLLGALLTGLIVLIFLRDWRGALIVVLNIPFALLGAVILLWGTGQTINIMTLGGLALAVGVLVDESTVSVENIHTQMRPGTSRARAVLDASSQTAIARLLAMLCILAVFVPSFFMAGVARQLFVPLSLAVGFAMIASYLLSSTLVPVFSTWLMRPSQPDTERHGSFNAFRSIYERYLNLVLRLRWPVALLYLVASIGLIYILLPRIGTEIFPDTDARLLRIRLRAPTGTRVEETERITLRALDVIKQEVGADKLEITSDFVGVVPSSYPVDLIHLFTSGPQEAIIQFALKAGAPRGEALREHLRAALAKELPGTQVSFEAGDIVSQVMSFGSPTPIEVTVLGGNLQNDYTFAQQIQIQLAALPFLRDLQIAQDVNYPTLDIDINRERAGQFGLTMADVTRSVVPATSSSRFTQPNYWRDPELRQRVSDPGRASAEPPAERRGVRRPRRNAGRPSRSAPRRYRHPEIRNHARPHRTQQRPACHQPHRQFARHDAWRCRAKAGRRHRARRNPTQRRHRRFPRRTPRIGSNQCRSADRSSIGDSGNFPPARGQLPVDPPCVRDPTHRSRSSVRRPSNAAPDQHHAQPPVLHGSDHGGRHRGCEFDSVSQLRRAFANCRSFSARRRAYRRQRPPACHSHDGHRHDLRDDPHGHGFFGRRIAIHAARPRSDRRLDFVYFRYAHHPAFHLRDPSIQGIPCVCLSQSLGPHEPIL